jgi:hypothetical protein
MAKYLYTKKKYEIERLLERASVDLCKKHENCAGVRFGEAQRRDDPTASRKNWDATISGGPEGRARFEDALEFMRSTNRMVD